MADRRNVVDNASNRVHDRCRIVCNEGQRGMLVLVRSVNLVDDGFWRILEVRPAAMAHLRRLLGMGYRYVVILRETIWGHGSRSSMGDRRYVDWRGVCPSGHLTVMVWYRTNSRSRCRTGLRLCGSLLGVLGDWRSFGDGKRKAAMLASAGNPNAPSQLCLIPGALVVDFKTRRAVWTSTIAVDLTLSASEAIICGAAGSGSSALANSSRLGLGKCRMLCDHGRHVAVIEREVAWNDG